MNPSLYILYKLGVTSLFIPIVWNDSATINIKFLFFKSPVYSFFLVGTLFSKYSFIKLMSSLSLFLKSISSILYPLLVYTWSFFSILTSISLNPNILLCVFNLIEVNRPNVFKFLFGKSTL